MSIEAIGSTVPQAQQTGGSGGATGFSEKFEDFLQLFTTQIENQDPLDPMDASEYTNQLVQYGSLEQQMKLTGSVEGMIGTVSQLQNVAALGYLDQQVVAEGSTTAFQDGSAAWRYEVGAGADSVSLSVLDGSGREVFRSQGSAAPGSHDFAWDGTTTDGRQVTDGAYTLVVNASSQTGQPVESRTYAVGRVTGVDSSSGTAMLEIGEVQIALDAVVGARAVN